MIVVFLFYHNIAYIFYYCCSGIIHLAVVSLALTLLPLLMRKLRNSGGTSQSGTPSPGSHSNVKTAFISMPLDHDTGQMDGTVNYGTYTEQKLSQLSKLDLINLLRELKNKDEQSAQLLEAYMDRVLDEGWRNDGNFSKNNTVKIDYYFDKKRQLCTGISGVEIPWNDLNLLKNIVNLITSFIRNYIIWITNP